VRGLLRRCALLLLRRGILRIAAAEIGAVRTIAATAAMPAAATVHSITILATVVALVVSIRAGILLRLPAAGDECRQAAKILPAFVADLTAALTATLAATLAGLLGGLLLVMLLMMMLLLVMLRPIVHLLIAWRERLSVARNIWLLLRFARRVARLVLSHERLGVIVVAVEAFVAALLLSAARALLLGLLLIVVGVLLPELLLRGGDQTEIMFGVLVVILGCHRVAGPLRVSRKLNIFFCNMGSGAADLHVGTV
jgi:hypothetical protein